MTTNKHIEAKPKDMPWKEARENLKMHAETFPELLADVIDSAYLCGLEATNSEAYLLGQDSVRECVPEEKPTYEFTNLDNLEGLDTLDKYAKLHERVGFNSCREQTLSNIRECLTKE